MGETFNASYTLYSELFDNKRNGEIYAEFDIRFPNRESIPEWLKENVQHPTAFSFSSVLLGWYGGETTEGLYCKPAGGYTTNDGQTMVVTVYQNENQFNDSFTHRHCFDEVYAFMNERGFNFSVEMDVLRERRFIYPSVVPPELEANGWYERMEALQGVDGVYFVGEVVGGGWILNTWDHQTATFPSFYTDYQALVVDSGDSDGSSSDSASSDANETLLIVLVVVAAVSAVVFAVLALVYRQKALKLETAMSVGSGHY